MELFNNAIRTIQIIKENLKDRRFGILALWCFGYLWFLLP